MTNAGVQMVFVTADGAMWCCIRITDENLTVLGPHQTEAGDPGRFVKCACANASQELHLLGLADSGHLTNTRRAASGDWDPFLDVSAYVGELEPIIDCGCGEYGGNLIVTLTAERPTQPAAFFAIRHANGVRHPFWTDGGAESGGDPAYCKPKSVAPDSSKFATSSGKQPMTEPIPSGISVRGALSVPTLETMRVA